MRFKLVCEKCDNVIWVRGSIDYELNAVELSFTDSSWDEACSHINAGDYTITDEEYDNPWVD